MALLVGIDEAGFGPILGPLVVSSAAFSLPRPLLETDLWSLLKKSIASRPKHTAGRILITDSKKAYNKKIGIRHLQRTILACLECLDKNPATLAELFAILCPSATKRLSDYPWYKNTDGFALPADRNDIEIASSVLADDLASAGIKLLHLRSCCLDVAHYNNMVAVVKNKAAVLFTAVAELIKNAFDHSPDSEVQIIIDRQGGRIRYRKNLQLMFPAMELKIIRETPSASSYELRQNKRMMRLHFVVGADERFLPVSLASMVSKYLRELLIRSINRYFAEHCASLKPTAGYWKDGLRFLEDLKTNLPNLTYDKNRLIRIR